MGYKKILLTIIVSGLLFIGFLTYQSTKAPNEEDIRKNEPLPASTEEAHITPWQKTSFAPIPPSAEIIFHKDGYVFTATREGKNITQITHEKKRDYEHVAVSYDHRFITGDENPHDNQSKFNLWVYDLQNNTEAQLVPEYYVAGDGGVDWDHNGFIYFKCKKERGPSNADLCKIKYDGTGFQQLTNTPNLSETDVSVSEDGAFMTYALLVPEPQNNSAHTEVWVSKTDGTDAQLAYVGGTVFKASVHDPENSPDNKRVIFSKVDSSVPPNYANIGAANTAHNIYTIDIGGTDLKRLTKPGPISILPDWKGNMVVYTQISEKDKYSGGCWGYTDKDDQLCNRVVEGASATKFIP